MSPHAYENPIERLKLVLEVSRHMASTFELEPLLERVAEAACRVLRCERATVFLLDKQRNELYSKVATGVDEIRFPADRGIAGEVATTGRICNVPDAYADPRFNQQIDRQTGFHTRNILAFPLIDMNNVPIGVLQVLNKYDGPFSAEDEELAITLSAQAGVAIQRQILLDEYAHKQQMERELDLARSIQRKLLPERNPTLEGYDIAGWNRPADQTGGDAYNFLEPGDGGLGLVLADATGHGIGAALVIAQFHAVLSATAGLGVDLGQVMRHVNNNLTRDLPDDRFVTTFVGRLNPTTASVEYVAAGQGPLIHYHYADGRADVLPATDMPLGIMEGLGFAVDSRIELAPGDILCLLTDGFYEWAREDGEQFSEQRAIACIRSDPDRPAEQLIETLYAAVLDFAAGTPQADDLTAIVVRRMPRGS